MNYSLGKKNFSVFLSNDASHRKRNQYIIAKDRIMLSAPRPSIVGLHLSGRPSTIAGRVVAIIVDAINRLTLGWMFHIFQKILKAISPSFANLNSSLSIVRVIIAERIVATVYHHDPNTVDFCFRHAMSFASSARQFTVKTATGLCISASHIGHSCAISFVALTKKNSKRHNTNSLRLNTGEATKDLSNPFNLFWHESMINTKQCFVKQMETTHYAI